MSVDDLPVRPLPDGSDVKKVEAREVPRVAKALSAAFFDDPVYRWLVPDDSRRTRQMERGFDLYTRRIWLRHGECYTTDRLIGAAMWMPPGTWPLSVRTRLALGPALVGTAGRDLPRLLRLIAALDAVHPKEPHYYLAVLGVDPEWAGRGFGSALMTPILERCDRERLPAYLEATTPRNRALYQRHGFEVVGEVTAGDSPPSWRMWREPRS